MLNAGAIGVGLRNELMADLLTTTDKTHLDFLELAPENWMGLGGIKAQQLKQIADRFPLVAHGLSLSIGDAQPLNIDLLKRIKQFLSDYQIEIYSEHISFGRDHQGYLYDLLPVPFYEENLQYLSKRILQAQEVLGKRIAFENISYYHPYPDNMLEVEFITALLKTADCDLLLDINNVYVNSQNHGFDPYAYISALPRERVRYLHIAGHYRQNDNLILDTHGMPVNNAVWDLLAHAYSHIGLRPTLLERDHHVPNLLELRTELDTIHQVQSKSVPARVQEAMKDLSNGIRENNHSLKSVQLYHELLSSAINDIIESGYPRLFQVMTPELKNELLKTFLKEHACSAPEHHQLPTEFLTFLQNTKAHEVLKKIAEYEWLELNAEIGESVHTAQLVALPFDLNALSSSYIPLPSDEIYYRVIYRNGEHAVKHASVPAYMARLIQLCQQNAYPTREYIADPELIAQGLLWLKEQNIISFIPTEAHHETVY